MTDDGRWFAHISDTGYKLFHGVDAPMWRQFVREAVAKGITSIRAASLGGWGGAVHAARDDNNVWVWNDPWEGGGAPDYARFDLAKFQNTDNRLIWIFDNYPDLYLQFVLFGLKGYGTEDTGKWWASIPRPVRNAAMKYMLARWSAFPNLFWLIVNDMHCSAEFPTNRAFVREVGSYLAAHDPWQHLISAGPNRRAGFPFTSPEDLRWVSYIHIEDADAVGAAQIQKYGFDALPLHVFMGEDYYEHYRRRYADSRFYFRWLMWSWLLSGGSANYGGRYGVIHPYQETGRPDLPWIDQAKIDYTGQQLTGLDSVRHIWPFFRDRNIDLGYFRSDDDLVRDVDGRSGLLRAKLMRRDHIEFLVYHPNAESSGEAARVDASRVARMHVDLTAASGAFRLEWYRPYDGVAEQAGTVEGGAVREVVAPWKGHDVVLRLLRVN